MGLRWTPARSADLFEAVDANGRHLRWTRRNYAWAARQMLGSEAWTARTADGVMVLVTGLWTGERDHLEGWSFAGPGLRPNLLATVRDWRAMLEHGLEASPGVEVRAYVEPGGVAGPRLARWLGFEAAGEDPSPIGPLAVFRRRA